MSDRIYHLYIEDQTLSQLATVTYNLPILRPAEIIISLVLNVRNDEIIRDGFRSPMGSLTPLSPSTSAPRPGTDDIHDALKSPGAFSRQKRPCGRTILDGHRGFTYPSSAFDGACEIGSRIINLNSF